MRNTHYSFHVSFDSGTYCSYPLEPWFSTNTLLRRCYSVITLPVLQLIGHKKKHFHSCYCIGKFLLYITHVHFISRTDSPALNTYRFFFCNFFKTNCSRLEQISVVPQEAFFCRCLTLTLASFELHSESCGLQQGLLSLYLSCLDLYATRHFFKVVHRSISP